MPHHAAPRPTAGTERIALLDVIRGAALCGILLANLTSFFGAYMTTAAERAALPLPRVGGAVLFAIDWLVEGKFYCLFSMLFGVGFALQRQRAAARGDATFAAFDAFFRRRMLVLIAIGLLHMVGLWYGDILLLYGLMGLALPTLARLPPRRQLCAAALLLATPVLIHAAMLASAGAWDPRPPFARAAAALRVEMELGERSPLALFVSDDARTVWSANLANAVQRPGTYLQAGRPAKVLGLFLLGAWLAAHVLPRLSAMHRQLRITLIAGATLGLVSSFVYARIKAETGSTFLVSGVGLVQTIAYNLGTTPLALAYAAGLARLSISPRAQRLLQAFVPLGRMALTVYLLQTIVQLAIFSGYGPGLAGRLSFACLPPLALLIIVLQQRLCVWWLSRFAQGPVEWAWRRLTYGAATRGRARPARLPS